MRGHARQGGTALRPPGGNRAALAARSPGGCALQVLAHLRELRGAAGAAGAAGGYGGLLEAVCTETAERNRQPQSRTMR